MGDLTKADHVYIDEMVTPVSQSAEVPKVVARRVIMAFCRQLNEELSQGRDVTLREVGRFKVVTIPSYWKYGLGQERRVQKKYKRVYFTTSQKITERLNHHER